MYKVKIVTGDKEVSIKTEMLSTAVSVVSRAASKPNSFVSASIKKIVPKKKKRE